MLSNFVGNHRSPSNYIYVLIFQDLSEKVKEFICPICFEEKNLGKSYAELSICKHKYCLMCINKWKDTQKERGVNPVFALCRGDAFLVNVLFL